VQNLVRDLNRLYRDTPALHARDCEGEGFEWLIADDRQNSVYAWQRRAPDQPPVAVIANFTPIAREDYRVPLPFAGRWREILNSDAQVYGGSGTGNLGEIMATGAEGRISAAMVLPGLSTIWLQYDPDE
jgi:1,4-alpha-glucan branching enzyme